MQSSDATAEIQRLSPWADAAPSPYARLQPGHTGTLNVAFSYTQVPAGQFTFDGPAAASANAVLHLNVRDNDYYQNGIPGVTESVAQTAAWLGAVRGALSATRLRMIGASMGGYAALLFGEMLQADAIYAFSPVLRPGHLPLGARTRFRDISSDLPAVARRAVITFGAFEISDYHYLLPCLEAGLDVSDVTMLANFHPGLRSVRLEHLFAATDVVGAAELVQPYASPLDRHDLRLLAGLMEPIARGEHAAVCAVLGPLTRRDRENPGLLYRLGMHQALAGWTAAAAVSFRGAAGLLRQVEQGAPGVLGEEGDLRRKSVRDYAHLLEYAPMKVVQALMPA